MDDVPVRSATLLRNIDCKVSIHGSVLNPGGHLFQLVNRQTESQIDLYSYLGPMFMYARIT